MTYAKDWRSFPPAFIALVHRASVSRFEVPCEDAKGAKRLEGKLHAFFGVLHRAAARATDDAELRDLDNLSRRVQCKAVNGTLVCVPRDLEPDNLLVQSALDRALGLPAGSPVTIEASAVRMSAEMEKLFAKTLTD